MVSPLLKLQPISHSHFFASGDVTVHDSAAIAPGVLLKADPNSRIVIGAGVCIGIGSILHARDGTIEVAEGANLGAEVLVVGAGTIGAQACVGSATTIFNTSVGWGQVIPPGSLVGDNSRPAPELQATETVPIPDATVNETDIASESEEVETSDPWQDEPPESSASVSKVQVYGKVYVNQLLVKMFPHQQAWNKNMDETSPPPALGE